MVFRSIVCSGHICACTGSRAHCIYYIVLQKNSHRKHKNGCQRQRKPVFCFFALKNGRCQRRSTIEKRTEYLLVHEFGRFKKMIENSLKEFYALNLKCKQYRKRMVTVLDLWGVGPHHPAHLLAHLFHLMVLDLLHIARKRVLALLLVLADPFLCKLA